MQVALLLCHSFRGKEVFSELPNYPALVILNFEES
jgi:hypothetical protein